ncbi:MAG: hypothetical protein J8272_01130, partial ['Prunus persica' phytoplasma PP2]|nr:hypothetical protein ['Prunus persica' phytoplasma PP2]
GLNKFESGLILRLRWSCVAGMGLVDSHNYYYYYYYYFFGEGWVCCELFLGGLGMVRRVCEVGEPLDLHLT